MPRPNPRRDLQSEANLARRVAFEREKRGWTNEGLAKRMTDVGCPIQGSAIFKIEKGNPPRRITVDELVALARVFDLELAELLVPTLDLFKGEVRATVEEVLLARMALLDACLSIVGGVMRLRELAGLPWDSGVAVHEVRPVLTEAFAAATPLPPGPVGDAVTEAFDLLWRVAYPDASDIPTKHSKKGKS